ncbi:MAG TPA: AI-2E family transporter [Pyrinomonadaceae bacterium]|nr:AI-2E family transporter [Pyrinomonadaceae bacterium]
MDRPDNSSDDSKTQQARWFALLAVTVLALYLCWLMLVPFIQVLLWAVVLVIVFYPVHKRIERRLGSPSWAAVLSTLLVIVTILVPMTLITLAVVRELSGFAQTLQGSVQSLLDPNSPTTGRFFQWLGQYVDVEQLRAQNHDFVAERLRAVGQSVASRTLGFVGGAVGLVVEVFFVIFTMYYLFRDGARLRSAFRGAMPLNRARSHEIFGRTKEVISASVYGVLVIAAIQGVLGGFAFWALGLPSPLLWGVVMVFLSMIPMAGAFVVWVPAALYLGLAGAVGKAIMLSVWGALVIGSVDNFLRPKLVGEKTRLHELLIFFSVLGGLQVFGVIGLVLGPVIVAVAIALLEILRQSDDSDQEPSPEQPLLEAQAGLRDVAAESS